MSPIVVLVGPPGAGKSTVGLLLAQRLGASFRDSDGDVEAGAGQSVADIFVDFGEERFRELERAAVRLAVAEHDGVLALGGGAVLDPQTRSALADQRVVFLEVGLAQAATRVGLNTARPLLVGNVRSQLKALLDARRPYYDEVATVTVSTDDRSPEQVGQAIVDFLVAEGAA